MAIINQQIWSPNWSSRPNGKADVLGVVLHHTATRGDSAIGVARFFETKASKVSAHFVVNDDGYTVQCVSLARAAWHAGPAHYDWDHDGKIESGGGETSVNTHSIGIEICNLGNNKDNFPEVQIKKIARIISWCDDQCPHLSFKDVTDHEAVLPGQKIDMQANFPAAKLFWYILHGVKEPPPVTVYQDLPRWAQRQVNEIKK
jgi:N-acetyl-anhydromuramyl-L-alanine amidase AmpD